MSGAQIACVTNCEQLRDQKNKIKEKTMGMGKTPQARKHISTPELPAFFGACSVFVVMSPKYIVYFCLASSLRAINFLN